VSWLLGGLALVAGLGWLLHAFAHSGVARVKRGALWLALGVLLGVAVLLLLSGRGAPLLGLLLPALPWLWPAARRWWARRRFAAPGENATTLETATLAMRLDPVTSTLSGRVLAGPLAGRELAELSLQEARDLLAACHVVDPESVPLLESWLDRTAPHWRVTPEPGPSGALDRATAYAVLQLPVGAGPDEIRAAHRRLMRDAHPDHGGDPAQAALLNQARDLLLGG
jgi:hypothetical protein